MIKNLGERIKHYRNMANLTQEELAKRLNLSHPTLNKYEKGHRIPDAEFICRVAEILNCDPGFLLTGIEKADSNTHDEQLKEIVKFLLDYPEDKAIILKLLKARKEIRDTYKELGIKSFSFADKQ